MVRRALVTTHQRPAFTGGAFVGPRHTFTQTLEPMTKSLTELTDKQAFRISVEVGRAMKNDDPARADELVDKLAGRLDESPESVADALYEKTQSRIDGSNKDGESSYTRSGMRGLAARIDGITIVDFW